MRLLSTILNMLLGDQTDRTCTLILIFPFCDQLMLIKFKNTDFGSSVLKNNELWNSNFLNLKLMKTKIGSRIWG